MRDHLRVGAAHDRRRGNTSHPQHHLDAVREERTAGVAASDRPGGDTTLTTATTSAKRPATAIGTSTRRDRNDIRDALSP